MKRALAIVAICLALFGCARQTILPGPDPRPLGVIQGDVTWSSDGPNPRCEVEWLGQPDRFTYRSLCWHLNGRRQIMWVKCPNGLFQAGVWRKDARWSAPAQCPTGKPTFWHVEVAPIP